VTFRFNPNGAIGAERKEQRNEPPKIASNGTWVNVGHPIHDVNSGLQHGARILCYTNTYANSDIYANCYINADSDIHTNIHAYADVYTNCYNHSNQNADTYTDEHVNTHASADTHIARKCKG
jgi:hypothetical protein